MSDKLVFDKQEFLGLRKRLEKPEEVDNKDLDVLKEIMDAVIGRKNMQLVEFPPIGSTVYDSNGWDYFECIVLGHDKKTGSIQVRDMSLDLPEGRVKWMEGWVAQI